ncbi:MAG: hypothetical protein ACLRM8_02170 [Alistipes sp.]
MLETLDHAVNVLAHHITSPERTWSQKPHRRLRLQRQPRQMDPVRQFAQAPSGHAHLERVARCRTLCRRGRRAPTA